MNIDIKGDIVIDDYAELYQFYGWDYTCPYQVRNLMNQAADDETIDVYINSGGGHVEAGQKIYSMLRNDRRTRIHVQSMACSAASLIAMAGISDISPAACLMVHNVAGGARGDYHEMEKAQRELMTLNEAIASAYVHKSGMSMDDALAMMDRETWLTARQCVEMKLIDAIDTPANGVDAAVAAVDYGIRMTPEMMEKAKAGIAQKKADKAEADAILADLDKFGA